MPTPMRAKTAPEFDRALECARLRDRRPDRAGLRPARRDRARPVARRPRARGRPARRSRPAQARPRAGRRPRARLPQARSRTARPRSRRGWSGSRRRRDSVVTDGAVRPTIPAERYAERLRRAVEATADARLRRAAGRGRSGPALPDRLRGDAARAADDARRHPRPGAHDRRPAARARRGRGRAPDRRSTIVTWDEVRDPHDLVTRAAPGPTGHAGPRIAVSDSLWASHLLRLQAALAGRPVRARVAGPARPPDGQGRGRDRPAPTRGAGGRPGRGSRSRPDAWSAGPRPTSPARSASGSSPRATTRPCSRSSPRARTPRRRTTRRPSGSSGPGEPIVLDIGGTLGGYGSDITRTLWVTGGDPANGPDERFRHLFGVLHGAQAAATRAVRPGRRLRGDRRGGPATDRGRGLRRGVLPSDRARDRARGPRGPVPDRGQRAPAPRGDGVLGRARHLPRRASTGPASRTSSCADPTARSCSTRRRASCTSSTADPVTGARAESDARLRYHRPTDRPDRSANDPSTDDQPPHAPLPRRLRSAGTPDRPDRLMSRRHGRTHHHERGPHGAPRPGTSAGPRPSQRDRRRARARSRRRRSPSQRAGPATSDAVAPAAVAPAPAAPCRRRHASGTAVRRGRRRIADPPRQPHLLRRPATNGSRRRSGRPTRLRKTPAPARRRWHGLAAGRVQNGNGAQNGQGARTARTARPARTASQVRTAIHGQNGAERGLAVHRPAAASLHQEPPVRADARAAPPLRDRRRRRRRQPDPARSGLHLRRPAGSRGPAPRRAAAAGEIGYELSLDPRTPIVVGVYPMRRSRPASPLVVRAQGARHDALPDATAFACARARPRASPTRRRRSRRSCRRPR